MQAFNSLKFFLNSNLVMKTAIKFVENSGFMFFMTVFKHGHYLCRLIIRGPLKH